MEIFQEKLVQAQKKLSNADHMLTITYSMVKDSKLLLSVLDNIYQSQLQAISALLHYERTFKNIPAFSEENSLITYQNHVESRLNFDAKYRLMLQEIKELMYAHKNSPIEFGRENSHVILDDESQPHVIKTEQLKEYVTTSKEFLKKIVEIMKENESVFSPRGK